MIYLLQVLGTYNEVQAVTVGELERKAVAMRDKRGLSGMKYRIFKKVGLNQHGLADMRLAKEGVFS